MNAPLPSMGHRLASVLVLLLGLAGLYGLFHFGWWGKHQFYQEFIETQKNWLRRYRLAELERPLLEQALAQLQQSNDLVRFYLPPNPLNLAAGELQQRVQQFIQSQGGSVSSSQLLPAEERGPAMRIALRVQFTAGVDNLHRILHSLEASTPLLFIEELQMRARTTR